LWPGAGWGIVDSLGRPKAAYWYLARACAPLALLVADEGLNGLWLHVVNDTDESVEAELRVTTYGNGVNLEPSVCTDVEVPAHGHRSVHANALFESFRDLTCAYRLGSREHDVVACTLRERVKGAVLASAHYFPHRLPGWPSDGDIGLTARVESIDDCVVLALETTRFAYAVEIDLDLFVPDDNYLHLEPGETRRVGLRPATPGALPAEKRGRVSALNSQRGVTITVAETVDVR
jgi:beta-mannosidase